MERKRRKRNFEKAQKRGTAKRRFDPVLKNLFSETAKVILALAGIKEKGRLKPLPTEINITKTLRIDMLLESPSKIYQIEIHGYHDPKLPRKMFEYYFAIDMKQREELRKKQRRKLKEIEQVVIWTGKGKPPPSEYRTKNIIHKYKVVDVKEVSPEKFLNSKNPYEVILALAVGRQSERRQVLPKVIRRLQKISKSREEFIRYIEEITVVAKLFDLEVGKKMDWMMKIIGETFPFKKGLEKGRKEGEIIGEKEGEKKGLQEAILLYIKVKFGRDKARIAKDKIQKIHDIRKLRALHTRIIKSENWSEVRRLITQNEKNRSDKVSKAKR